MRNLKILIIDDEKDYCMIMKSYFIGKKYEVFLAYNLKDGLKLLEEQRPDVLLLDNNLPDGKGRDQIEPIMEKFPSLRLYLISAYHQKGDFLNPPENVTVWEKPILLSLLDDNFSSGAVSL
jgi:DNA-binding response OmpR family regulator